MALDHGILNLSLNKRGGDVLFGISRKTLETQQRADAKAAIAQRKADKAQARALLAQHGAAIVARHGARFGERALRDLLESWAKWEPSKLIAFVAAFQREVAA